MKTKADILNQMDEVIQYFINHPDNQPNTDHCRNVDRLINLKADLANGDNTESDQSINYDGVLETVACDECYHECNKDASYCEACGNVLG